MLEVNLRWTNGEEVLFKPSLQMRREEAVSCEDTYVMKIESEQLTVLQH